MTFQTEFEFTLPRGYVDKDGTLHKYGIMRLATAADEILPLRDPKVQSNAAYFTVILLSRVVTKLGSLEHISTNTIENLFALDFAYLQDLYSRINGDGTSKVSATCPKCGEQFDIGREYQGE